MFFCLRSGRYSRDDIDTPAPRGHRKSASACGVATTTSTALHQSRPLHGSTTALLGSTTALIGSTTALQDTNAAQHGSGTPLDGSTAALHSSITPLQVPRSLSCERLAPGANQHHATGAKDPSATDRKLALQHRTSSESIDNELEGFARAASSTDYNALDIANGSFMFPVTTIKNNNVSKRERFMSKVRGVSEDYRQSILKNTVVRASSVSPTCGYDDIDSFATTRGSDIRASFHRRVGSNSDVISHTVDPNGHTFSAAATISAASSVPCQQINNSNGHVASSSIVPAVCVTAIAAPSFTAGADGIKSQMVRRVGNVGRSLKTLGAQMVFKPQVVAGGEHTSVAAGASAYPDGEAVQESLALQNKV